MKKLISTTKPFNSYGWASMLLLMVATLCSLFWPKSSWAHPFPPLWDNGVGAAVHFAPAAWPSEPADPKACGDNCGDWQPYTRFGYTINDPRTQDPSNGGTAPQNYVNISSSCSDQDLPSIYHYYDAATNTLMFRWRVEQIANTYATGPSAGNFSTSDPWSSALWTVFFDMDGNGFRELASHLNGSSGSPASAIDQLVGIWGNIPTNQSLDYLNDPNVHLLAHNPTGFIDAVSSRILNYQNTLTPQPDWPKGAAETTWDYGTTRSRLVSKANVNDSCNEYFVDYQIPLQLVDASSVGGPQVSENSAFAMLFCTANSLNNPFQKDCAYGDKWIADPSAAAPFGDYVTLDGGTLQQPLVGTLTATSCGPATLSATVRDTLDMVNGAVSSSVNAVDFYAYFDANGDGLANDGGEWTLAANGSKRTLTTWSATWNNDTLLSGSYLVGIQAVDMAELNIDGKANRTFSYLSPAEIALLLAPSDENWYANLPLDGTMNRVQVVNSCGLPTPYLQKRADVTEALAGTEVRFAIDVHNTLATALTLTTLTDTLPSGFIYGATDAAGLGALAPAIDTSGPLQWNFAPAATIPAHSTATLTFTATTPQVAGTYANRAIAASSSGLLEAEPLQIGVGAPRLTLAKSVSSLSADPGEVLTYTLTYGNDSPVAVSGAVISDVLPAGLTLVSALNDGSYDSDTRTITWQVGDLSAGDGPFTVSFAASIDMPYPDGADVPLVNTATLDSPQTSPANASATTYIHVPRPNLTIHKSANVIQVSPGGQVIYTINYQNVGNVPATGVVVTDAIPAGFSFISASGGGANSSGTVIWNIGSLIAGGAGSVSLTLQASNPFPGSNSTTNTAVVDSNETNASSDTAVVGISMAAPTCSDFYFRNQTTNVGTAGSQRIADSTLPTSVSASTLSQTGVGSTAVEIARFYSDPVSSADFSFTGPITTTLYVNKDGAPQAYFQVELYSYNPAGGGTTLLGSGNTTNLTGNPSNTLRAVSITPSGSLPTGYRLLWIVKGVTDGPNTNILGLNFDGTSSMSRSAFCTASGAKLVIDKQASSASIVAGEPLSYSLRFANIGGTNATGTVITDTLPVGLTFQSATLNGVAVTPSISGQQLIFAVRSSETGTSGQITGGQSGTLVINVTVDPSLDSTVTTLLNSAAIASNQTAPTSDTATITLQHALLSLAKSASSTLLTPGDIVTFTLTVLNSGNGAATNVTLTDPLPVESFFTYVAGSTRLNNVAVTGEPVNNDLLTLNIGNLPVGASSEITFRMQVAANGMPDGVTTYNNSGTVSSTQTALVTSNIVTLALSTNPYLQLTKSYASSLAAGELMTYTLTVVNSGGGAAEDVVIVDPIPANTSYLPNSLIMDESSLSDAIDSDGGSYAASQNQVRFALGTVPAGESHTLQFTVRIDDLLPNGATVVTNQARVSASNSTTRAASVSAQVNASPLLTLDKQAPAVVAFPATVLTSAAENTTLLTVASSGQLAIEQYISVNGQIVRIVALGETTVTVDSSVTAPVGTSLIPGIAYTLYYGNEGTAIATNVRLTDTLPSNTSVVMATTGWVQIGNEVVWQLADLAPGDEGMVELVLLPTSAGTRVNLATLDSAELRPQRVTATATTVVGGVVARKHTLTPIVTQSLTGTTTVYVIEIENTLPTSAEGVVVTDTLPAGLVYRETIGISGGTQTTLSPMPVVGDEQPAWGQFSIPAYGTLSIQFVAQVDASAGAASYQNMIEVASTNVQASQFDALATTMEDVTILVPAIVLSKEVTPSTVPATQHVTYTLVAQNMGDGMADGVSITDSLPSGFTYQATVNVSSSGAVYTEKHVPSADDTSPHWGSWEIAPLGAVTITFTAKTGLTTGTFFNTVLASADNTLIVPLVEVAPVEVTPYVEPPQAYGQIEGIVFSDANGNQVADLGETGLGGVTIEVRDSGDQLISTTTTAVNGSYVVQDLPIGSYTVREIDPAGYISTTPNEETIEVTANASSTVNFGDQQMASVAGIVYHDVNGNQVADGGEATLAGVTLELVDSQGTVTPTTSQGDGSYLFSLLPAGTYTVTETDPDGYISTTDNVVPVTLVPGAETTVNFGDQQTASVVGIVFVDQNSNYTYDLGEPLLSGVVVELISSTSTVTVTTAVDGSYGFASLLPGSYTVLQTQPSGYLSLTPDNVPVVLTAGGASVVNFAEQAIVISVETGMISGTVFHDFNGNGLQEPEEIGLEGAIMTLEDVNGATVTVTTTAGDGGYRFGQLAGGSYHVVESDPPSFVSTTPNRVAVTLLPDGSATVSFGDQQLGAVAGTVFLDSNRNEIQDVNEVGLEGITVTLHDALGNEVAMRSTTADGRYEFDALVPGGYRVTETIPESYIGTTPDSVDTEVTSGGLVTADFGNLQVGTIRGIVFEDANANGVYDSGETGISGIEIELLEQTETVERSTQAEIAEIIVRSMETTSEGDYLFSKVPVGVYTLQAVGLESSQATTPLAVDFLLGPLGMQISNFGYLRMPTAELPLPQPSNNAGQLFLPAIRQ